MTDFEQWKQWLDKWNVEYEIKEYKDFRGYEPTIEFEIDGVYAYASIVFKASTKEFMYVTAQE